MNFAKSSPFMRERKAIGGPKTAECPVVFLLDDGRYAQSRRNQNFSTFRCSKHSKTWGREHQELFLYATSRPARYRFGQKGTSHGFVPRPREVHRLAFIFIGTGWRIQRRPNAIGRLWNTLRRGSRVSLRGGWISGRRAIGAPRSEDSGTLVPRRWRRQCA
jgi:hypothetical protein